VEPLRPGDPEWIGDYRLLGRLGAGGMGTVYLARTGGNEPVAVKVIREDYVGDPTFRARFRREITAAREVAGAYTAAVLAASPEHAAPWLVIAYVPGMSLREAVQRFGALPEASLRPLANGLADALAAIHRARIAHRDLKPENVMLAADGPKVIDFGVARPAGAIPVTGVGHKAPWTASYLAPEQLYGDDVAPYNDLFTFATVVLYAATGEDAFPQGPVRDMPSLRKITDPTLREAVADCLNWEQAKRPTAQQLLDRLCGGSAPSLQGTDWLPARVAREIGRREVETRRVLAAPPPPAPPKSPTMGLPTGADPNSPDAPSRRLSRRTLVVGVPVVGAALAGTVLALWPRGGRDRRAGPPVRSASPSGSPSGPPPVATERWKVKVGSGYPDLDVAGGRVLAWTDRSVHALDPGTGRVRWRKTAVSGYDNGTSSGGSAVAVLGQGSTYRGTVADGMAYTLDVSVYPWALSAVRAASGTVAWRYGLTGYPLPTVRAGGLVCLGLHGVRALHADTGHASWSAPSGAGYGLAAGSGLLVAVSKSAMVGLDAGSGRQRWRYTVAKGAHPLVAGTLVFVYDEHGVLHAVRADGGSPAWRRSIDVGGDLRYGDGILYATAGTGDTYALRATTGEQVWHRRFGHGEGRRYGYANVLGLSGRTLYVGGTDGTVYAVDAASGDPRWTYPAAVTHTSPPVGAAGLVFVGTGDGYVHALVPPGGGADGGA
jgi:outer membrane protein assembly factor BamB